MANKSFKCRIPTASYGVERVALQKLIDDALAVGGGSIDVYGVDESERYRIAMTINKTFDININKGETLTPLGKVKSATVDGFFLDIEYEIEDRIALLFESGKFVVEPKILKLVYDTKIIFFGIIQKSHLI